MSVTLAVIAVLTVLCAAGRACWPRLGPWLDRVLLGELPDDEDEPNVDPECPSPPLIRPAAPDMRPVRVWQSPHAAAADPMRWPLRRDERHVFDELVYVHDFLEVER